ncbi:hypothetical protein AB0N81_04865 [Streptomyces sp. NPDC093510]|uniref:hypothetical protein n=1 Tax=Streptomyces sp. NPDC093510 TaxID=3155199 RepID=UPI003434025D
MEHNPGAVWLTEAAKAAEQQGPGNLLRIVLIVMVAGCVLVGWFLLRGYRQGGENGDGGGNGGVERTPDKDAEKGADKGAEKAAGEDADKSAGNRNG